MKTVNDLQLIKKYYGENMMHLCRTLFPTLLEKPGLLFSCLSKAFAYSKFLYDDIVNNNQQRDFVDYIYSYIEDDEKRVESDKTPQELLDSVGYDLYECHTEADIQSFRKYYVHGEDLCTFDGGRLDTCYVFFAVKKNVDEIKRENFKNPRREDKYGTSVMSIQFDRARTSRLSIKNRYNHTVDNPDATYSNNLDNIVRGLTNAFLSQYPYLEYNSKRSKLSNKFTGYVKANDGKLYKYYYKNFKTYYCPDNVIVDNGVVKYFDKNKYLLFDQYILDIDNKSISKYIFGSDSFTKSIGKIDKLLIRTTKNGNKIIIINYNTMIILNSYYQIIEYHNNIVDNISYNFLDENNSLRIISLPNVIFIDSSFLARNKVLEEVYLPNVEQIKDFFLSENLNLRSISLPKVLGVSYGFLQNNRILDLLYMPEVRRIGSCFLYENRALRFLSLPNAISIDHDFMPNNNVLQSISLDKVKYIWDDFLRYNNSIEYVNLPNAEEVGDHFMDNNLVLKRIGLISAKSIGDYFLRFNECLEQVDAPLVEKIGSNFLPSNNTILRLDFPRLKSTKENFMLYNKSVQLFNAPNLETTDYGFFYHNENIDKSNIVRIEYVPSSSRPKGIVLMGHYHVNSDEFHRRRRTLFDILEPLRFNDQPESTENTFDEVEEPVVLKKVA